MTPRTHRRFAARAWNLCQEATEFGFPNSGYRPVGELNDDQLQSWVLELTCRLESLSRFLSLGVLAGNDEAGLLLRKVRRLTKAYRAGRI